MHDSLMILRTIEIAGGLLFLIAPFTPRFRRGAPHWICVISFLAGLFAEVHVGLSFYLDSLRPARDLAYWHVVSTRCHFGGLSAGLLLSLLVHHFLTRDPKSRNA